MAFNCDTDTCGLNAKPSCVANVMTSFSSPKQQLQRDVKKVAAAARGIKHRHGRKLFLEFGKPFALRGVALAFDVGGGKFAFDLRPFAAEAVASRRVQRAF